MTQKTTAQIVQEITVTLAGRISRTSEEFNVYVIDDGAGPYISLNRVENDEDYRCLSLTDEVECGEDLSKYKWNFWNNDTNTHEDSELDSDAPQEQVLEFLNKSLAQEKKDAGK